MLMKGFTDNIMEIKDCLCVWLCILILAGSVMGDYILKVRIHNYSNPNNFRADGDCCDDCDAPQCDTYFCYCLRSLGTPVEFAGNAVLNCNGGRGRCSGISRNDAPIDFSQNIVLGLSNPLPLSGLTTEWNGVQFVLSVIDDDPVGNPDDLITVVGHDISRDLLHLGVESKPILFNNVTSRTSITLSFLVLCAQNYYSQDCSRFCERGCTCDPGFTGEFCHMIDSPNCLRVNCSGNGRCIDGIDPFICHCNTGYTGAQCDVNIDDCTGVSCSGNGRCIDGIDSFICNCYAGYTGKLCDVNIDDCGNLGVNCSGNGQCIDGVDSFFCYCNTGYTGALCDVNIDDCNSTVTGISCSGNGQCIDGIDSFICHCNAGYTGKLCDVNLDDCGNLCASEDSHYEQNNSINLPLLIGTSAGALVTLLFLIIGGIILFIKVHQRTKGKQSENIDLEMERRQGDSSNYTENVSYRVNIYQSTKAKQRQEPHSRVELSSNVRNPHEVRPGLSGPDSRFLTCIENVSYGTRTRPGKWRSEQHYDNESDSYDYI